ncbi:MAG: hypothetical protein PQJ46_05465, partial [Spirochaetales bacterium]|nr:hypothetical protein [Spirochaetales bacterium]
QKMKFILISNKFDYKNFLDKNGYTKERLYSHGTIKHAFIDYCKNIGIKTEDLSWLMNLDQLYSIRRKVDYDERYLINPFEFNKQFVVAENIIDNIDCIEE